MAQKKSKVKSNVGTTNKKSGGFKFRAWMAVVLIIVVAAVGIAVVRFSNAAGDPAYPYILAYQGFDGRYDKYSLVLYNGSFGPIQRYEFLAGGTVTLERRNVDNGKCYRTASTNGFKAQGHATVKAVEIPCP